MPRRYNLKEPHIADDMWLFIGTLYIPLLHNYSVVPNGDECKKYRTPNIDKYQQNEVEQIHILDTHYFAIKG